MHRDEIPHPSLSSMLDSNSVDLDFQVNSRPNRSGAQRHYRKILRVADLASCSESGEGWSRTSTRERCQGYPNPSLRPGDVVAGPFQHLPTAVFGDVYLRDIRDVLLHACQGQERTRRCVQFQDVWAVDDTAVPGNMNFLFLSISDDNFTLREIKRNCFPSLDVKIFNSDSEYHIEKSVSDVSS